MRRAPCLALSRHDNSAAATLNSRPAVREQPWQGTVRLPGPGQRGPDPIKKGTVFTVSEYLITCTRKSARTTLGHQHITSVGVGIHRYTVAQVYALMEAKHTFRTVTRSTGELTPVGRYHCCGLDTLRSFSDRAWDDNLDNLPECP